MNASQVTCPAYIAEGRCDGQYNGLCKFNHELNAAQLASLAERQQQDTPPHGTSTGGSGGSGGSSATPQEMEEKHGGGDGFTDVKVGRRKRQKLDKSNSKKGDKPGTCNFWRKGEKCSYGRDCKFLHANQPGSGRTRQRDSAKDGKTEVSEMAVEVKNLTVQLVANLAEERKENSAYRKRLLELQEKEAADRRHMLELQKKEVDSTRKHREVLSEVLLKLASIQSRRSKASSGSSPPNGRHLVSSLSAGTAVHRARLGSGQGSGSVGQASSSSSSSETLPQVDAPAPSANVSGDSTLQKPSRGIANDLTGEE